MGEFVAYLRGRGSRAAFERLRERSIEVDQLPGGVLVVFVEATSADSARARIEEALQGTTARVSVQIGGEGRGQGGEHERSP